MGAEGNALSRTRTLRFRTHCISTGRQVLGLALIPPYQKSPRGGRPRVPDRVVMAGILYRLRTGCQWKALPREFGSGSTCHLRFQEWAKAGVFEDIHRELLKYYDQKVGIDWDWSSLDGALVKAPKGGT